MAIFRTGLDTGVLRLKSGGEIFTVWYRLQDAGFRLGQVVQVLPSSKFNLNVS